MTTESAPGRVRATDAAVALSLASVCYLRLLGEVLAVTSAEAYYSFVHPADIAALMLNVLLLAALFLAGATWARRGGVARRRLMVAGFVAVLLVLLNQPGPLLAPGVFTVRDAWRDGKVLEAAAHVVAVLIVALAAWRWPRPALRLSVWLFLALSPFALLLFGRGALALWRIAEDPLAARAPAIGAPADSVPGPRVVVILLDALSRHLAFDARPAGLALPELDRLRAEGLDATQVEQAGWVTRVSVPAILSGLDVESAEPSSRDDLALRLRGGDTVSWAGVPNLMQEAQATGGVAVVAGWYHPYCRLFAALDGCASHPARMVGSRARATGFWRAVLDQQLALIPYTALRRRQIDVVEAQRAELPTAATMGGRGFVFLHVSMPHTPWIWDAARARYTLTDFSPDGYFGNVALADRMLGEIRRAMERAGHWDSTAVLVLSDHVMRYRPAYLREPDDRRVPFIVKLPGAPGGVSYAQPFNARLAHPLIQQLLRGEPRDYPGLAAWLDSAVVSSSARAPRDG